MTDEIENMPGMRVVEGVVIALDPVNQTLDAELPGNVLVPDVKWSAVVNPSVEPGHTASPQLQARIRLGQRGAEGWVLLDYENVRRPVANVAKRGGSGTSEMALGCLGCAGLLFVAALVASALFFVWRSYTTPAGGASERGDQVDEQYGFKDEAGQPPGAYLNRCVPEWVATCPTWCPKTGRSRYECRTWCGGVNAEIMATAACTRLWREQRR